MSDFTLNVKGVKCPIPIIRLAQQVKLMDIGQTLEVTADDPIFEPDVKAWGRKSGHSVESITKSGNDVIVIIKKTKQ